MRFAGTCPPQRVETIAKKMVSFVGENDDVDVGKSAHGGRGRSQAWARRNQTMRMGRCGVASVEGTETRYRKKGPPLPPGGFRPSGEDGADAAEVLCERAAGGADVRAGSTFAAVHHAEARRFVDVVSLARKTHLGGQET